MERLFGEVRRERNGTVGLGAWSNGKFPLALIIVPILCRPNARFPIRVRPGTQIIPLHTQDLRLHATNHLLAKSRVCLSEAAPTLGIIDQLQSWNLLVATSYKEKTEKTGRERCAFPSDLCIHSGLFSFLMLITAVSIFCVPSQ